MVPFYRSTRICQPSKTSTFSTIWLGKDTNLSRLLAKKYHVASTRISSLSNSSGGFLQSERRCKTWHQIIFQTRRTRRKSHKTRFFDGLGAKLQELLSKTSSARCWMMGQASPPESKKSSEFALFWITIFLWCDNILIGLPTRISMLISTQQEDTIYKGLLQLMGQNSWLLSSSSENCHLSSTRG